MRISPFYFGGLVLLVFLGTILGFQSAGIWSVSGKVDASGNQIQPIESDVNSIKGWMTLEQITTTYQLPLEELLVQFQLPADTPASTAIKDLESDLFSVTNLRIWLEVQNSSGEVSPPDQTQELVETPIPTLVSTALPTPTVTEPTAHAPADRTVTGKTTFQQLFDWGLTSDAIEAIIGGSLPSPAQIVKDYVTQKGMDFPTVKAALQAAIDQK